MNADWQHATRGLTARWLLAHAAAYALAALLGTVLEFALEPSLFRPGPPYHVVGDQAAPAGLLLGVTLAGIAQGLRLRRAIPNWWRASLLGSAAGLALGGLVSAIVSRAGQGGGAVAMGMPVGMFGGLIGRLLVFGLVLGLAQWLVLRRRYPRAWEWPLAHLITPIVAVPGAWVLSLMWGMPLAMITTLVFSMARPGNVGDVVGGLVLAGAGVLSYGTLATLVTGLTLRWVLGRPAARHGIEPRDAGGRHDGSNPTDYARTGIWGQCG